MENKEEVKKEGKEKKEKEDYLLYKLETPVEFEGSTITEIDLRSLRGMNFDKLCNLLDTYAAMGGTESIYADMPMRFAKIVAGEAAGLPVEAIGKLGIRDAMRVRMRIYRFFYLSE